MPTGCLPNKHKDEEPLTSLQVHRETEQTDRRCYSTRSADGVLWERERWPNFISLVSFLLFSRCLSSKETIGSLIEWPVPVEHLEMCLAQGNKQERGFSRCLIRSPDLSQFL